MSYQVRAFSLSDTDLLHRVHELRTLIYGNRKSAPQDILKITVTQSKSPTIFLGAFEGSNLIGCKAFMPHDFLLHGKIVTGYQSGFSMTHPEHRGKKVFVNLIEEAKQILKDLDAAFIFGFPNHNSAPIFKTKLNFRAYPLLRSIMINGPGVREFQLHSLGSEKLHSFLEGSLRQDEQKLFQLKQGEETSDLTSISHNGNFIWGRYKVKKIGPFKLRYFDVGGMGISSSKSLSAILKAGKLRCPLIAFTLHPKNPYRFLFKKIGDLPSKESFIIYDLNFTTTDETPFAIMSGLKDVF